MAIKKPKPKKKMRPSELRRGVVHLLRCVSELELANKRVNEALAVLPAEYEMALKIAMDPKARIRYSLNGQEVTKPVERAVDKLNEVARAIQERQGAEFASILDP